MTARHADGSAGDADCGLIGTAVEPFASMRAQRPAHLPATITSAFGSADVIPVPIPLDCTDGFGEAYYRRPEALLDQGARPACSAWSFVDPSVTARFAVRLGDDLRTGASDARHGQPRAQTFFGGSLTLIIG
jgi:hypothetical protein